MTPAAYITERRDYFATRDPHNGWSANESGPCCEKCKLLPEHFTGRADALKAFCGCRDPFQVECRCHIPTREAVTAGIVETHNQLIKHFEREEER